MKVYVIALKDGRQSVRKSTHHIKYIGNIQNTLVDRDE